MRSVFFSCVLLLALVADAQSLKVMTYDLRYDNPGDGRNQWMNRKGAVAELISKYDPSLVGVQEALHHQLKDLMIRLPGYTYIGVGRDDGKEKGEYAAIIFKKDLFDVVDWGTFWLSASPKTPGSIGWDAAITRIVTWSKFKRKDNGQTFIMLNTHFDHIGEIARENSAKLLKKKTQQLAGKFPVIITGDFNSERVENPYHIITTGKGMPLTDTKPPQDQTGTYCGFKVGEMPCKTIDYIFISSGWKVENYQVIHDHSDGYYPSDHLPVMVDLSY